jgi:hypothetical protein
MIDNIKSIKIEGKEYYTVKQFAALTNRAEQSVRNLINKGNRIRKLKSLKIGEKLFVLASELQKFPFTSCGPNGEVYHYNDVGEVINEVQDKTVQTPE